MSKTARTGDALVLKTLQWVDHFQCAYIIENPVGMLRKMPFMVGRPRRSLNYCRYGDSRSKPTDLWSNIFRDLWRPNGWEPLPRCHNNNPHCHHDRQPRSYAKRKALGLTKGGTCGLKSAFERSQYPPALVSHIMDHLTNPLTAWKP